MTTVTEQFQAARDLLVSYQTDYEAACSNFEWPRFEHFNFALDWFDHLATAEDSKDREALVICETDGSSTRRTFAEMSARSAQLANWLEAQGVQRGDRVMLMLNNQVELWECMLACIKAGFVLNPATAMLGAADLQDRTDRANISWVVANAEDAVKFQDVTGDFTVIQVGDEPEAQSAHPTLRYSDSFTGSEVYTPKQETKADETLLLYFTSGTTSKAKLVEHTHTSYPVGHLTTMYWIGLAPGDVHLNVAAPGWAKHAWSNFFAPWIAGATIFLYNYARFDAAALMDKMEEEGVTSFCAPPTVWRMLVQADLGRMKTPPKKLVAAGEPLNPELISTISKAWHTDVRDGFGQTETTLQIANTPEQKVKPGSMGRPLPGWEVVLKDPATDEIGDTGEICLKIDPRPVGLTVGYFNDPDKNAEVFRDGYYHTGDTAERDEDGYIFYIGRADDVFKASDYRLSPFELESVVIEHPAVAEVAVVPSPDPIRLAVPKAYVALANGYEPNAETAEAILKHCRDGLAPYKRIRRLEFYELPKTVSGKIRRVDLRKRETEIHSADGGETTASTEFADSDFPSLKG
ncbi:AMP-binding protein [Corynebacterium aurimucosum]|uniref:Putative acetyl-coenzyme A synthetase n=1 Tax=Corynebacterium aurimucosum (strain ATCC 700975 / DSM 44827 / CIP 107346 / CN-1) TaxID=548476 RepID=C3PF65_CORA7|nr:AMP-binding protein [Corynebacterium aurimucosum]ACP32469.1 putative acetyl-coenzyme A synthetase [Corynebacterium aurimucosum ATCC 700975]QQU93351.1 AMP-binding protein [Corynebacterium aurimucosum]